MKNEVHLADGAMRWAAPPPDNFRDDSGAVAAKGEIVSLLFINNCCWGSPKPIASFYGQDRHQVTETLAYKHWEGRGRPLGSPDVDWYAAEDLLRQYMLASGIKIGPDGSLYVETECSRQTACLSQAA